MGSKEHSKTTSNQTQQLNPLNQLSQRTNKSGATNRQVNSDNDEDVFTVKGIMPAGSAKAARDSKGRQYADSTGSRSIPQNTVQYSSPKRNTMRG